MWFIVPKTQQGPPASFDPAANVSGVFIACFDSCHMYKGKLMNPAFMRKENNANI